MANPELQKPHDELVGLTLVGRYHILHVIGEGGMGRVYLAEQKMGNASRKVAVKTLHPELVADPQLVERFHRESSTVIQLQHPNTIQFFDFGELEDGTLFIVMEFIAGESLADQLSKHTAIDHARMERIVIQICGSLQEAHHLGVVHRDLKPDNVLLTDRAGQRDFVKVLDFGIAKRSEAENQADAKLTKQGMILGTPPYMSPEQFTGVALDARSDIYSLAVMVYEMLTGELPFTANTPWEWASQHLTAQPRALSTHPRGQGLPPRVEATLMQALAKNRDERPPTVADFLRELTGHQDAQQAWSHVTASSLTGSSAARSGASVVPGTAGPAAGHRVASGLMVKQDVHGPTLAAPSVTSPSVTAPGPSTAELSDLGIAKTSSGKTRTGLYVGIALLSLILIGGAVVGFAMINQRAKEKADALEQAQLLSRQAVRNKKKKMQEQKPAALDPATDVKQPEAKAPEEKPKARDEGRKPNTKPPKKPATPPRTKPDKPEKPDQPEPDTAPAETFPPELQAVRNAIEANELRGAARLLGLAQAKLSPKHSGVKTVKRELQAKGSNAVGIFIQQGHCADAQALYRTLRAVQAEGNAASHFSSEWCPKP